jgi:type IV pilus assembly protein PilW
MIAITLGMLVLTALVSAFVNSSRTRDEIERASQQIENGRYAMEVLSNELRLAGYWAEFNLGGAGLTPPTAKPDPCSVTVNDFTNGVPLLLHVQGYDLPATAPSCVSDFKAGTDILVVRRVSTCLRDQPDCPIVTGAWYFQASLCNNSSELGGTAMTGTTPNWFKLDTSIAALNRQKKGNPCTGLADMRQFITRIYFVANNDAVGDGIPTLKRVELANNGIFTAPISVAPGIEDLQFEYGLDTIPPSGDGVPDVLHSDPDTYSACAPAACVNNWLNVMTVKINLLARNTTASASYSDSKTYTLGMKADQVTPHTVGPFNNPYKRHVYQAEVRLANAAGRREP